jgi:hypothetical protein
METQSAQRPISRHGCGPTFDKGGARRQWSTLTRHSSDGTFQPQTKRIEEYVRIQIHKLLHESCYTCIALPTSPTTYMYTTGVRFPLVDTSCYFMGKYDVCFAIFTLISPKWAFWRDVSFHVRPNFITRN